MHAPAVAHALCKLGHDVLAVAGISALRAMADDELFAWAGERSRRIVTENVKDCRRLLLRAEEAGQRHGGLLYTSSRSFSRYRRNPGPLIAALTAWLCRPDVHLRPSEDWLRSA